MAQIAALANLEEDDQLAIRSWLRVLASNEGDLAVEPRRRGQRIIYGWCHYCGRRIEPDGTGALTLGHDDDCFVLVARRIVGAA